MNRATIAPADRMRLAQEASEALAELAAVASRRRERHAATYGLSDAKLGLMAMLSCCDGRTACLHAIGDELCVTRPNVTKLVDGLERSGLVERIPHPRDRRMVQAHLTEEGERVAAQALPGRRCRMEAVWDGLGDEELAQLTALLRAALEGAAPPGSSA
jgi:DNA-binding MarR family transcriptional regulator